MDPHHFVRIRAPRWIPERNHHRTASHHRGNPKRLGTFLGRGRISDLNPRILFRFLHPIHCAYPAKNPPESRRLFGTVNRDPRRRAPLARYGLVTICWHLCHWHRNDLFQPGRHYAHWSRFPPSRGNHDGCLLHDDRPHDCSFDRFHLPAGRIHWLARRGGSMGSRSSSDRARDLPCNLPAQSRGNSPLLCPKSRMDNPRG